MNNKTKGIIKYTIAECYMCFNKSNKGRMAEMQDDDEKYFSRFFCEECIGVEE